MNDQKLRESSEQQDRIKAIEYELSRSQHRIDDNQKQIDSKSYDHRNKQIILQDSEQEILKLKDSNAGLSSENVSQRRDLDRMMAEAYDLRKENDYQGAKNGDNAAQIRDLEMRIREKEDQLFSIKKDQEQSKYSNSQMRDNNVDLLNEKDALEKHAQVL